MMNRLRAFMAGRNGIDGLGYALLIAAIIVNLLARMVRHDGVAGLLSLIAAALILCFILRVLSRNLAARQKENRRFMALFGKAKGAAADWKYRRSCAGEYKFFTCPGCRNKLRVPRGKGKIQITCPKCGQRFGGKS